ncbi:MAG: 4Fe-4S binding protein [Acholeplasmataceae bacterium]|nr:4Fe-4S binding protein [Acholeplasmataceae bacterium]
MKIAIFIFSGTGNTYFIGRKIQDELKENGIFCDLFTVEKKHDDDILVDTYDVIGLGYPIYGSDVPQPIRKWINGLKMHNSKRAFVFCTQMMYSGDGAAYGGRLLEKKGFVIRQQAHFNMPNNITDYKILRPFNKHNLARIEHRKDRQVRKFVKNILVDKRKRKGSNPISLGLGLLQRIPYQKMELKWISDAIKIKENCILCKKCIELCPTENFEIKDGVLSTKNQCIACYRCINHCPVNALHSSKNALVKNPYKGPAEQFNIKDVMEDHLTMNVTD